MVGEMSSILRELEQVQDQLGSLTKDAQAEKTALMGRQEELRTRAARLADQIDVDCSTQDLLAQLAGLHRQRDALARQRAGAPSRQGSSRRYPASPPNGVTGHSRNPQNESGLPRIDERIHRIEQMLSGRGINLK
jgi:hypothetical protein